MSTSEKNNDTLLDRNDNNAEPAPPKTEEKAIAKRERSEVGFNLQPRNLKEALKICEYLASSSMVPKQYQGKPEDILVAINWGQEVGLKPLQSLNSIAVVNGTPSMYGAAPLALARQHPEFEWILEDNEGFAYARDNVKGWEHLSEKNPDDTSICVVKRKGEPPVVREFSKEDVQKAGLGNVHKSYPKDMRKYRARSRGLEAAFGDVLKGIHQAEIIEENQRLGVYDDELRQPEQRQEIDFDQPAQQIEEQPTPQPDSTNGNIDTDNSTETDDREVLKAEVNKLGKEYHGKDWFRESKSYAFNLNEDAEGIHQLEAPELKELKNQLEYKLEKQNAKAEA